MIKSSSFCGSIERVSMEAVNIFFEVAILKLSFEMISPRTAKSSFTVVSDGIFLSSSMVFDMANTSPKNAQNIRIKVIRIFLIRLRFWSLFKINSLNDFLVEYEMNFIKNVLNPLIDTRAPDYYLFIFASLLIIVSIVFSYSLSIFTVDYFDYSQFHFFIRQFGVGIVSIFIMWSLAHVKPEILFEKWKIGWWLFGIFGVLMVVMHMLPASMVTASGGANRWIRLPGFSLAPVEFFKIGFIFFLSASFTRKFSELEKVSFKEELKMLLPYGIVFGVVVLLIAVFQKDLGQVVLLGTILFVMLIFANRSVKLFLSIILVAIIGFVTLIVFAPHRINRFQSWWSSVQDTILSPFPASIQEALKVQEFPEPYQVSHSLNAIFNGGWSGVGLSEGGLKLGFLSEVHTDFVLAGITEEIGLIGLSFILVLLFFVIFRILRTSRRVDNHIYHLFCLGIALMISVAFLINSYGITGVIPIKGIAVPFLSYGGSSILALGIAVGMVLSISKTLDERNTKQNQEEDYELTSSFKSGSSIKN